jgi:hypothetical protein
VKYVLKDLKGERKSRGQSHLDFKQRNNSKMLLENLAAVSLLKSIYSL